AHGQQGGDDPRRRLRRGPGGERRRCRAAGAPYRRVGHGMIDWLRRGTETPSIRIGGRELPLAIRRHARAKRLTMRLAPDGSEVRITLPRWGRTADAVVFAGKRADWLERQLARIPPPQPPRPGGTFAYRGAH